jgi:hypothetical protein
MKNFVKFYALIAMMFIVACSEDIFLHDGHSTLEFFDESTQTIVHYLDKDYSLTYTSGDVILFRETKEGLKVVQDGECYDIFQVSGTAETLVATVCNGQDGPAGHDGQDGQDGQDGEDGYSLITKSVPYADESGKIIGQKISFYLDKDRPGDEGYGILSSNDVDRGSVIILNGKDAIGKTVMVNWYFVESTDCASGYQMIFTSSLDGVILSQAAFCVPADGQDGHDGQDGQDGTNGINGITPSLETENFENGSGILYRWYLDLNHNGIYNLGTDLLLSEDVVYNGENGTSSESIVSLTLEYNFQGAGTSYFNSTGFYLNGFVLNDGALYLDKTSGYVLLPPFDNNMDLLSFRMTYGSINSYNLILKAIYSDGTEEEISQIDFNGNPQFNKGNYSTYSKMNYYANLNSIQFKDIKRIKILAERCSSDCTLKCTSNDLVIDNIVINLRDRNNH